MRSTQKYLHAGYTLILAEQRWQERQKRQDLQGNGAQFQRGHIQSRKARCSLATSFRQRRLTVGAVAHAPRPFVAASLLRCESSPGRRLPNLSFLLVGSAGRRCRGRIHQRRRLTVGAVAHAPRPSLAALLLPTFNQKKFDAAWPFLKIIFQHLFCERRLTVGAVAHAPRPFFAASFQ